MRTMVFGDTSGMRDLARDALDENGDLEIMPASFYAATSMEERALFCVRHGLYGLHTLELIDYLRKLIDGRTALEIGAGNGVLARALGIRATDNCMQAWPDVRAIYEASGQKPVRYGADVEDLDAIAAIRIYAPRVVVGSWITHLYRPEHHDNGGNQYAPDERELLRHCSTLILIGNDGVHRDHPLLQVPHQHLYLPFLYSRAFGSKNFLGVWKNDP